MLLYIIPLLFLPLVIFGWYWSRHSPKVVRKVTRFLILSMAIEFVMLVSVAIFPDYAGTFHKSLGFGLQFNAWLCVPVAIGVVLQQQFNYWPIKTILHIIVLVLFYGFATLSAITGYLGPTNNLGIDGDTYNRFVVLHCIVLPLFDALLMGYWFWLFRPLQLPVVSHIPLPKR